MKTIGSVMNTASYAPMSFMSENSLGAVLLSQNCRQMAGKWIN